MDLMFLKLIMYMNNFDVINLLISKLFEFFYNEIIMK